MSLRTLGVLLLLAGSLLIGLAMGQWCFRLWQQTIPQGQISPVTQSATHVTYVLYGLGMGVAVFAWSLLAAALGRFFKGGRRAPRGAAPPAPPAPHS